MGIAQKTEDLIILIAQNDDESAFKEFFDNYYDKLLNFANFFLESPVAAEEVVSTVFINIWKNRKKLLEVRKVEAYLFTATKLRCFSYLRDNQRFIQFKDIDSEKDFFITDLENPEILMLNAELRTKIIEIIEELPPKCKMIFTLIREDGLKYKEVAELMEISVKTVEIQMSRALLKLRNSIEPYMSNSDLKKILHKVNKKK